MEEATLSSRMQQITEVVERYSRDRARPTIVAVPGDLLPDMCNELLRSPEVAGLVLGEKTRASLEWRDDPRVGVFRPALYQWQLPGCAARNVIFFGFFGQLSFRMARAAMHGKIRYITYMAAGSWRQERVTTFLLRRSAEKIHALAEMAARRIANGIARRVGAAAEEFRHCIRSSERLSEIAAAGRNWVMVPASIVQIRLKTRLIGILSRAVAGSESMQRTVLSHCSPSTQSAWFRARRGFEARFDSFLCAVSASRRLQRSMRQMLASTGVPLLPRTAFESYRVLLVNSSLAWGGAERQIVNTLTGLRVRADIEASLLVEHLHDRPEHDFYLWQLEQAGVHVTQLREAPYPLAGGLNAVQFESLQVALSSLPPGLSDDIMRYALEFADTRPAVVHVWQDSTSIKAGFAAALVGVPRIVLGSRNMSPVHFAYHLPYMRPGYRVLASLDHVAMLNNSRAGAVDYTLWLGLPSDRYQVLFNGIRPEALEMPSPAAIAEYRHRLGIPIDKRIVGSIFRFYEEKDPLLWLDTVALIAERRPDCVFLLVGTGIMKEELEARAEAGGLKDKLIMPGTEKHPVLPLALMDVFLLTSKVEGTPNVVIEAQWSAVPVVATDAGGTRDTIEHGVTGWIVKSRASDELADRVVEILEDEAWARRARERAPVFARERFGFDRMIDDTLAVYDMRPVAGKSSFLDGPHLEGCTTGI